jgi:hypothetical protein
MLHSAYLSVTRSTRLMQAITTTVDNEKLF